MNVLITNVEMDSYSGTTLYVKELALGFKNAGDRVEVFTLRVGIVGEELQASGILVTTKLKALSKPDIVHLHNNITAWPVLFHFKNTPMVFWIHNRLSPLDIPPRHKNIIQYMAVDYNCKERYTQQYDFKPESIKVRYNWVNLNRFKKKKEPAKSLKRALVFSNYATEDGYLSVIRSACTQMNIELEVMGKGTGTAQNVPEHYLGSYDLVFAKAKAAMEAMACGCAVIVCDFTGLAGLVTPHNYDGYRRFNFGMKLMDKPITVQGIVDECTLYNADDTLIVTSKLREEANFDHIFTQLTDLYSELIKKYAACQIGDYSFNIRNYWITRIATSRIWIGLWTEQYFPAFRKLIGR
ncbi:glycosyltransferase involved in cell wall biosynthesis [Roseivirga ehrenbergii]|uniref:Glycosyltransferase subfamily 4-like N-terminal domain-containing protein n=1 Tax=Roseivirga ehrenbergii (strain DSM 102268 / JCM 13514 / KCTC 12282 / NCIMB 14502 / KMM 6017) TaxID=279360 RepID=A0A150X806_ROSEK|nr:glycosyltransferase [Roseivirga ehrenbergii]KYG74816.1 hypothetical protein MB14_06320 [Roseivirga ehrenbergii]TCL13851.1 glycosyltransferase involved in cell wall biosynthesis [Roseivirga ehrenbergii]